MKRIGNLLVAFLLIFSICGFACACDTDDKTYSILYADGTGSHRLTVKNGELYQLESIPQQTGYTFLGLFDAEEGGKQYVHANGIALSPFSGKTDLLLYTQFAPIEYTFDLDYNGATHSSTLQEIKVLYNEKITGLPTDLTLSGKVFDGWYTAAEAGQGVQICDADGNVTSSGRVNESNFTLPANKIMTLYAHFVTRYLSVTLHYDDTTFKTVTVEFGDVLADVVPFQDVNGKVVSVWSTKQNDVARTDVFSGAIKTDLELYAAEYSTYVAFDTDGGEAIAPILGNIGSTVTLPTPTKKGSSFTGWVLSPDDEVQTSATLGATGVVYKATWRAYKVNLDGNGAASVASEVYAGNDGIARLPIPAKPNYVFAGWFDESQAFYWDGVSLTNDLSLTAKWVSSVVSSETNKWSEEYNGSIPNGSLSEKTRTWTKTETCNLPAELLPAISQNKINVKVTLNLKVWVRTKGNATATVKIDATVNNDSKNGPTMTATGGGYNGIFNSNPVDGPIEPEVRSTLVYSFLAPVSGSFNVKLVYNMNSNKENSAVTTDVHFICEGLRIEVSNV